mgnify:CR=1 FL=1
MTEKITWKDLTRREKVTYTTLVVGLATLILVPVTFYAGPSLVSSCTQNRAIANGVEAEAVIVDIEDTGNRSNHDPEMLVTVNVQPRRGHSYDAVVRHVLSPVEAPTSAAS